MMEATHRIHPEEFYCNLKGRSGFKPALQDVYYFDGWVVSQIGAVRPPSVPTCAAATCGPVGQDEDTNPRFVINATNVQTAVIWRFSRNYIGDYLMGLVERPDVSLGTAVPASSAFPPALSPMALQLGQPVIKTPGATCIESRSPKPRC
jgi:hypothetical protein